jgi:hypothetical protein
MVYKYYLLQIKLSSVRGGNSAPGVIPHHFTFLDHNILANNNKYILLMNTLSPSILCVGCHFTLNVLYGEHFLYTIPLITKNPKFKYTIHTFQTFIIIIQNTHCQILKFKLINASILRDLVGDLYNLPSHTSKYNFFLGPCFGGTFTP